MDSTVLVLIFFTVPTKSIKHLATKSAINLRLVLAVLCLTALNQGCARTVIPAATLPAAYLKLERANRNPIQVIIDADKEELPLGHQYLFPFFPLGNISAQSMRDTVQSVAREELSLDGYTPIFGPFAQNLSSLKLRLKIERVSLSGYDLILVRRIVCAVDISAELFDQNGHLARTARVTSSVSDFARFAFVTELERQLKLGISEAMRSIMYKLELSNSEQR